ncbi:hypothetical protein [Polyangium spumosum]|uniref:Uncharacterized protein n=1 Tax=Polyangium spumosum TaxID=889282 RepID=A0A6N7Q1K0_9BACT|nr:hypothetical protein [Polyangium spumosum]MRG96114.1 hypothetical protein [Polyangium spumosum]
MPAKEGYNAPMPRPLALAAALLALLAPAAALADPGCSHMFANGPCAVMSLVAVAFLALPIGVVGLLSLAGMRAFHVIGDHRRFPLALVMNLPIAFVTVLVFMVAAEAGGIYHPRNDRWSGVVSFGVPMLIQIGYVALVARAFRRAKA